MTPFCAETLKEIRADIERLQGQVLPPTRDDMFKVICKSVYIIAEPIFEEEFAKWTSSE